MELRKNKLWWNQIDKQTAHFFRRTKYKHTLKLFLPVTVYDASFKVIFFGFQSSKEKFVAGVCTGVLTAILFYIDRNPKKDERKNIERCVEGKNGAAAFYDCSYYLFLHNQEDGPNLIFYSDIIQELRKVYTKDEKNCSLLGSIWNGAMSWLGTKTQILSDQEFLTMT